MAILPTLAVNSFRP